MGMFGWRRLAIRMLYVSMMVIVLAMAAYQWPMVSKGLGLIGILLFCGYVAISFKYWRCPHCKEQFPVIYSRMDQRRECWHCLGKLE